MDDGDHPDMPQGPGEGCGEGHGPVEGHGVGVLKLPYGHLTPSSHALGTEGGDGGAGEVQILKPAPVTPPSEDQSRVSVICPSRKCTTEGGPAVILEAGCGHRSK